jgi:hypothetical protein
LKKLNKIPKKGERTLKSPSNHKVKGEEMAVSLELSSLGDWGKIMNSGHDMNIALIRRLQDYWFGDLAIVY